MASGRPQDDLSRVRPTMSDPKALDAFSQAARSRAVQCLGQQLPLVVLTTDEAGYEKVRIYFCPWARRRARLPRPRL
eukprot:5924865-Alexandrium_andersonii.AAC.1